MPPSTASHVEVETPEDPILDQDARWLLAKRVAASATLSRSPRLSRLLLYICEQHLLQRGAPLSEQQIASDVFERKGLFDPAADTIVRSHMLRLRQKLEAYFKEEGSGEKLRMSIPRGGYVPAFETSNTSTNQVQEAAHTIAPRIAQPSFIDPVLLQTRHRRLLAACITLSVLCIALILFLLVSQWHSSHKAVVTEAPGRHQLWSALFRTKSPTLLVAADSGLVLLHGITQQNSNLSEYLARDFSRQVHNITVMPPNEILGIAERRYTSFVDLELFDRLTHLSEALAGSYDIRYARDIHTNDLKSPNIILSGSQDANPWIELFEPQMNFVLHDDLPNHIRAFTNRAPRDGEQEVYQSSQYEYGVLAFLPNLSGTGNVLLVEGTSVAGTEAISDFLFEDSTLEPFLEKIVKRDGSLPHFEILLQSRSLDGSAARSQIVAYRLH